MMSLHLNRPLHTAPSWFVGRLLWCVALATVFFSACSPQGMGPYRLKNIGNEMVVIPPPYANVGPGKTIHFDFAAGNRKGFGKGKACSAVSGPFRLVSRPSGWSATLPSLKTRLREMTRGVFHQHLVHFLDQIDGLARRRCISISKAILFEQAVREAIQVAVPHTILYRYGYSAGEGVISLEPGMRLVIQRAEYNGAHKFLGTETVYYRIARDSKGRLHIHSGKTEHRGKARILPGDVDLGKRVRGAYYVRLFFSGNFVPHDLNYSALVIGTRSLQRMEAIAREIRAHPQDGCPARSGSNVSCKAYSGMVTVVAQLGVKVNGKKIFVAPGDSVRNALEKAGNAACVKNLRALHIKRQFLGHPVAFIFDPAAESIVRLNVIANDRLFCSARRLSAKKY